MKARWYQRHARECAALLAALAAFCCAGCGGGGTASYGSTHGRNASIAQLRLGEAVDGVIDEIGQPRDVTKEGRSEELNYGEWQLRFTDGKLASKSIVRGPQGRLPDSPKVTTPRVLGLRLGMSIDAVERQLGRPQNLSETWEGNEERVSNLRYGEWQLTFVNGRLDQRER